MRMDVLKPRSILLTRHERKEKNKIDKIKLNFPLNTFDKI